MTNCPPTYQNIQCESFGDRRKITSQLLRQFCKNDAYLKEQIDLLWDTTDPESRKRFYPPDYMDIPNSFGIGDKKLSTVQQAEFDQANVVYNFNTVDRIRYLFDLDLSNDKIGEVYNDTSITQCVDIEADSLLDLENNYDEQMLNIVRDGNNSTLRPPLSIGSYEEIINHEAVYEPVVQEETTITYKPQTYNTYVKTKGNVYSKPKLDAHFYGAGSKWKCNSHWYNGFDRTKNYSIKAKWKKDPYGEDSAIVKKYGRIPSVCHAQTFKALNTGRISKVSLHIQGSKNAVSPCVVEIRSTNSKGQPTDNVLARASKKFSGNDIVAFEFKSKADVTKGKTYAIVIRSPFSHFENCYRIGGWTTGCFSSVNKYYPNGSSYTSTDNGHTWKKNGKTGDTKSYGSHYYDWGINQTPVDFAFEVYVETVSKKPIKEKVTKTKYTKTVNKSKTTKNILKSKAYTEQHSWKYIYFKQGQYYLYLKPIQTNPIDWFNIESTFVSANGTVSNGSNYWTWEYYNPNLSEWKEIPNNMIEFDNNSSNYTVLKLRVRCDITKNTFGGVLSRDDEIVTTQENTIIDDLVNTKQVIEDTGLDFLKEFKLTVGCYKPSKAYLRTKYYTPTHTDMLGASLWSEVGAKIKTFGNAKVNVDIIREKQSTEHIKFYDLKILVDVFKQLNNETGEIEYIQQSLGVYATNQQVAFFEELNNLINNYETNSPQAYTRGLDMVNYVISSKNDDNGFIEWCKNQLIPVYFLPLLKTETTLVEDNLSFFDGVQLAHIPSYPLIGGDIGDDDIEIDTNSFVNPDNVGFVYQLPKSVGGMLSKLIVTYKTTPTVEMGEENSNEVEDDDEGFPVNKEDIEENVVETLKGIVFAKDYDSKGIYVGGNPSNGLKSGIFKVNEDDVNPTNNIDYGITSDGMAIVFNSFSPMVNKLFPNRYTCTTSIENGVDVITSVELKNTQSPYSFATTTSLSSDVNVSDFKLVLDLTSKTYQEFVDFEVNYDNGNITFYDNSNIVHGDFRVTYNPLWVRGLGIADFPLKMDLWKEQYIIDEQGIYKRLFDKTTGRYMETDYYEKTHINPYTNVKEVSDTFYMFRTLVEPRDNVRKLVINESQNEEYTLEEDKEFFVDYLNRTITLYTNKVNIGDTLTIHYTPNLTDNSLALGYRVSRPRFYNGEEVSEGDVNYLSAQPKDEDDVWIGMNYFTYRT